MNSFDSSLILDTIEGILDDYLNGSISIVGISNSEETLSRLAINRAYLCAYLHVSMVLADNGVSIIPLRRMKASEYLRTSATVRDVLSAYNGFFISSRLDTLFGLRIDADYCFEPNPYDPSEVWQFKLADGFMAITESRDIILEFDTEVQNKTNAEGHL